MAQSEYTFKLKATGGNEVKSTFNDIGKSGDAAFKGIEQSSANAFKYAKVALGATAALYAANSVAGFVKQQIDLADSTGKMAQKVGISVEELSKLQYAAQLADVDTAQLQTGLVKLSKGMVEAANGTGQARNAFSALGINVKNSDGSLKSSGDVLTEVAGKFAQYEDGANKTALAVQLFGKSGAELIPLLNAGADGIKQSGDELERFGGVITTKAAQNAELFNDNLTRLSTVSAALGKDIANEVMPYLNQLSTEFLVARSNGLGFMDMLSMGLRSTDYQKQLQEINKEIKLLEKTSKFFVFGDNTSEISSLEKQKKTIVDIQTIMMKDTLAGPPKPADKPTKSAPFSIDLEKGERDAEKAKKEAEKLAENYAKGFGRAQDANDKFIASIREMSQKAQLEIDAAFMTEPQKKFTQDMISINKSFLDTQAEVTKQYSEGKLKLSDYNDQAAILAGNYQFAAEEATRLKDQQEALNRSWEYGATKALNSYSNDVTNISRQVGDSFSRGIKGMEDSLVSFVTTGKGNFNDLADSMIADMVRIMIQQSITAPLAQAGSSFFTGLFNSPESTTSIMNGSAGAGGFTGPGNFTTQIPSFAGGGYTGDGSRAGGRDGKGGFLALLHPNESVVDHTASSSNLPGRSSGGNVTVNVVNNSSAQATTKETTDSMGNRQIEVLIANLVNKTIATGRADQAMKAAYGLRRAGK